MEVRGRFLILGLTGFQGREDKLYHKCDLSDSSGPPEIIVNHFDECAWTTRQQWRTVVVVQMCFKLAYKRSMSIWYWYIINEEYLWTPGQVSALLFFMLMTGFHLLVLPLYFDHKSFLSTVDCGAFIPLEIVTAATNSCFRLFTAFSFPPTEL